MTFGDKLHEAQCGNAHDKNGCIRYKPGSPHAQFYAEQARTLTSELSWLADAVTVPSMELAVLTVIGEIW